MATDDELELDDATRNEIGRLLTRLHMLAHQIRSATLLEPAMVLVPHDWLPDLKGIAEGATMMGLPMRRADVPDVGFLFCPPKLPDVEET